MECDVVIIGAGPAGLFAAAKLADHLKVILVDKGRGWMEGCVLPLKT